MFAKQVEKQKRTNSINFLPQQERSTAEPHRKFLQVYGHFWQQAEQGWKQEQTHKINIIATIIPPKAPEKDPSRGGFTESPSTKARFTESSLPEG